MFSARRKAVTVAAAACLALAAPTAMAAVPSGSDDSAIYTIPGTDSTIRTGIHRSGAEILSVRGDVVSVQASPAQAERLRATGLRLTEQGKVRDLLRQRTGVAPRTPGEFPPDDQGYHTYDEMTAELDTVAADHPGIVAKSSIGTSFEGRDIPMLKISDNPGQDEDEPEVLFFCNQHAREHLTTEMCLHIVQRLTDNYADPAIADSVNNREIWVVPVSNPDGSVFDVATGEYAGWRKNRQDTGTDVNRNWGYLWGCCGGSSDDPDAEDYRGPAAWSTPEATALRDFIDSRVVGGTQQIKAAIDFHTFAELVLWPFGHTTDDVTDGMTQAEYDRFERVGTEIADSNGYTPQQSSDLYLTDGDSLDWMWGQHKILAFTLEMYPADGGLDGFYPPDEVIPAETARNDAAVDILLREAGA